MSNIQKIIEKIVSGRSDNNIDFDAFRKFITEYGFQERIKGSHHIFSKNGIIEIINIQPLDNKAKSYQVKQVRNLLLKYKLI